MRAVLQVFENYQKARVNFVQTVAELATRPQNIEALQNAGVMQLLRPLLLDNVPSIQQSAALALGRLANYNDELAEAVVSNEVLPQLVYSLSEQNRFYKKAAAFVLRAVAKHSPQLAQARAQRPAPAAQFAAAAVHPLAAPRAQRAPAAFAPPAPAANARAQTRRAAHSPLSLLPHRRSSTRARSTRWWAASRSLTRASRRRRRGRSATSRGTTASSRRRWSTLARCRSSCSACRSPSSR